MIGVLEDLLNSFQKKYCQVSVLPGIVAVKDCFRINYGQGDSGEIDDELQEMRDWQDQTVLRELVEYSAPRTFGDLQKNEVCAYAIKGAPFLEKYVPIYDSKQDEPGTDLKQRIKIKRFDADAKVLACLCLYPIRNTSFHELKQAFKYLSAGETIQGFTKSQVLNLEQTIQTSYPEFISEQDSFFIFAGKPKNASARARLSKIWLKQILKKGGGALTQMSFEETQLMEQLFPKKCLAGDKHSIEKNSYMWGRDIYVVESTDFLSKKVKAYGQFKRDKNPFKKIISWYSQLKFKHYKKLNFKKYYRAGLVDTVGSFTYSLGVGIGIDIVAGLAVPGIVASRTSASIINILTGGVYGLWRDFVFKKTKTKKESPLIKKTITDFISFNTFQLPVYSIALTIGTAIDYLTGVKDSSFNLEHIVEGMKTLAILSPIIGPTMGLYLNLFRKLFGVSTPEEKVI
ncbi:L-alanine exporter AlaE [Candidatus Woesearchaeota archaeon]|jgi:hypothetical protein|nr:L-alanine exporter AlaE [Candidatus Woesearchaeota archaeon]